MPVAEKEFQIERSIKMFKDFAKERCKQYIVLCKSRGGGIFKGTAFAEVKYQREEV